VKKRESEEETGCILNEKDAKSIALPIRGRISIR
jgi:hypothetical protein